MNGDDLKNWLAVLGIGGGLALAAPDTAAAAAARARVDPATGPPRAERGGGR